MFHGHYFIAAGTIAGSLFTAFGPLRHRLPRFLTSGAQYSVAIKLGIFASLAGIAAVHAMTDDIDDPRVPALFWSVCGLLVASACFIATRRRPKAPSPRPTPEARRDRPFGP